MLSSREMSRSFSLKWGRLIARICSISIRDQTQWACRRPSFSWKTITRGWPERPSFSSIVRIAASKSAIGTLSF